MTSSHKLRPRPGMTNGEDRNESRPPDRRRRRARRSGARDPEGAARARRGRRGGALCQGRPPEPWAGDRRPSLARRDPGAAPPLSGHDRASEGRPLLPRCDPHFLRRCGGHDRTPSRRRPHGRGDRRGRSTVLRLLHASACAALAALPDRDRGRRHRHVGLLVGCRRPDRPGRRCVHGGARDAERRRARAPARPDAGRRGDEARSPSRKSAAGAGADRPARARDLCRARHHDGLGDDAARREEGRHGTLFRAGAGAGLGDAMSGRLAIIGLGPGDARWLTPEAQDALADAQALYGYAPYLDRVPQGAGQERHPSDNREEGARAQAALAQAAAGARVALVSGGDPGVFAMAAAVVEAIERGPHAWRTLDVMVIPGITAMLAVAARAGAPLGHDFCAVSLSDNLKSWETIERRLDAAAGAGFVLALYNPVSRARPWQLGKAFARLRATLPA